MFSPDGHWVAHRSDVSGRNEIYVQPFPGPGAKRQISTEGGGAHLWARDDRELFYMNGSQMIAVDIETEPTFRAGTPRLLFEGGVLSRGTGSTATYDVTADGQRFVMLRNVSSEARINIVQNWFEELRQRVPTE